MAGKNWPTNPFRFRGKGTLEVKDDFVFMRGSSQRSFRMPQREEHRLRMVDIVNAYASGQDVWFDVLGVKGDVTVGFSVADARRPRASSPCSPRARPSNSCRSMRKTKSSTTGSTTGARRRR
jgi:hypothetical protein